MSDRSKSRRPRAKAGLGMNPVFKCGAIGVCATVVLVALWTSRFEEPAPYESFMVKMPPSPYRQRVQEYCGAPAEGSHGVLTTSEDLAAHMHGSLQLRYVHILARHGARTTVVELPNAVGNLPGSNDNKQPLCTPADLTVNELRQFHIHKLENPLLQPAVDRALESLHQPNTYTDTVDALTSILFHDDVVGPAAPPLPQDEAEGCQPGLLTALGVRQHRRLGAHLRRAYGDRAKFLPKRFDATQVQAQSTDYSRTIFSVASMLQGLFPQDTRSNSKQNIAGGVPIYVRPRSVDEALLPADRFAQVHCPKGASSAAWIKAHVLRSRNRAVAQRLAMLAEVPVQEIPRPVKVADVIYAQACHGRPLPCWVTGCMPTELVPQLLKEADWEYSQRYFNLSNAMLAQPLVERVLNAATQYLLHREGPKFVVSTMHDISLAPLLGTLGAYDRRWPPLASHVAFEVWGPPEQRGERTKLKDFKVRVLFNGADVTHRLACFQASSGSDMCPFSMFQRMVTPLGAWYEQCRA